MAFKTFAPGVLTSSDVNTFLMRQAVITCTSSTRPASPAEGMTIYETDTDAHLVYNGTSWVNVIQHDFGTFTPTWNDVTVGNGTVVARYTRIGKIVSGYVSLTLGSTSSIGTGPTIDIPVTASANLLDFVAAGHCTFVDSGTNAFTGPAMFRTGTPQRLQFYVIGAGASYGDIVAPTASIPFTWTTTDVLAMTFQYEAA